MYFFFINYQLDFSLFGHDITIIKNVDCYVTYASTCYSSLDDEYIFNRNMFFIDTIKSFIKRYTDDKLFIKGLDNFKKQENCCFSTSTNYDDYKIGTPGNITPSRITPPSTPNMPYFNGDDFYDENGTEGNSYDFD